MSTQTKEVRTLTPLAGNRHQINRDSIDFRSDFEETSFELSTFGSVTSLDNFNVIGRVETLLPAVQDPSAPTLVILLLHLQEHFSCNQNVKL